jgi:alpha-methylacyl-CoA racemase
VNNGPLVGTRILEVESLAPAPFGCMLLADLGAEVLRISRPAESRVLSGPGGPIDRGRRSLTIDLKSPSGAAALRRLSREADVLVEGFRPGVMERLGLGPEPMLGVNPRLVYARMTGWGQDGPLADTPGHDINYIAVAGALEPLGRRGEPPHPALNLLGDFAGGGSFLALGVLAALLERERSGRGQVVDAAMVDGASTLMTFLHSMRAAGQWPGERGANLLDGGASFYDTYATSDGKFMAVGAVEPQFYEQLLHGLGVERSTDDHFDPAGWDAERARFAAAFRTRSRAEWTEVFADLDACVTPVLSPWEAADHPHNTARKSFVEIDGVVQPAPAPRFSRSTPSTPVAMDTGGRDVRATLVGWGVAPDELDGMLRDGSVT